MTDWEDRKFTVLVESAGAFLGLTGGVQREHLIRSVLKAIACQVKEVVQAINQDSDAESSHPSYSYH